MAHIRRWSLWGLLAAMGVGAAAWTVVAQNTSKSTATAKAVAEDKADPQQEEILKRAKLFLDAFNKRDAKAVASLFTADAEMVERDGGILTGRKEIEESFQDVFKEHPKGKISLAVDSLRRVAPTVYIEEGRLTTYPDGKTAAYRSTYQVVHVRTKTGWLMAQARTLRSAAVSPHVRLKELEWMIGRWVDEEENSVTETTCEWSADGNFLLRKFTIKMEGERVMNGVQRVGWDPLTKQFKSWVFDSEGGYAEGLWSRIGDKYVIKARGVRQDGTVVTATNQFTSLGKDRMQWISVHRIAGNEHLPDVAVTIVRQPPKASR
jgi:uncharacterized protein (TIGR02246 family)